ncbi:MAG: hypothetical protein AB1589_36895 [Cyanobacteriota bacterium]
MIRQILLVSGIGAVVAGLASTANAQSTRPSTSNNGSVTLSGQSLRTIENRSIDNDFQIFFNGTSQKGTNAARGAQSPLSSSNEDRLNVVFGDTLDPETPFTFPNSGDVGDSERVKVQVQVGQ